ncbi:MAG: 4-hydroxy-tetrahydrodipicolinate reductase [Candidatus Omnitrophica bacterium]|nr:4-hydroxy-tetrahydrodipicolinate reductase [Candidatus Omnitrophota bacterium]MCM8831523.1 4-hydroxy-tetrahydrodipicolinate reductase [Candidatus Omnitrophota bacterium]
MIKVGISGFFGKMGQRIFDLARADKDFKVVFGLERKDHPNVNKTIDGLKVFSDPEIIKNCDCFVDFTTPQATVENLNYVLKYKKCAVIGTTGLSLEQQEKIKEASSKIPIVFSPNMSIGVNVLFKLVETCAKILKSYSVYIQEAHHIHKKDSPSGTAKKIAQIINSFGFNIKIEDIKAIREDEIVGDHKVVFESDVDKIELFHSAKSRDIFAKGALLAVKWIIDKKAGLYTMEDVLSLKI